jgi:hypothetical protein
MAARAVDRKQIALVSAIRAGVALSLLAERFKLDEKSLNELDAEYKNVPDEILFGINRLFDDNMRLKSVIADLVATAGQRPMISFK